MSEELSPNRIGELGERSPLVGCVWMLCIRPSKDGNLLRGLHLGCSTTNKFHLDKVKQQNLLKVHLTSWSAQQPICIIGMQVCCFIQGCQRSDTIIFFITIDQLATVNNRV